MTHIRIEQNNIPENVTGATIESLYNTVKDMNLSDVKLSGNLQVQVASQKAVSYLNGEISEGVKRFPNLNITAQKLYIDFEDPVVEQALVAWNANTSNHWDSSGSHTGDGIGVTVDQAADIKYLWDSQSNSGPFKDNTQIETFNEMPFFTGLSTNTSHNWRIFANSSIREVDLRGTTVIQMAMFENCTNLQSIGSMANVTYIGEFVFRNCNNLHIDVNLPNLTYIDATSFWNSGITSISNLGNITSVKNWQNDGSFSSCTSLKTIDLHTSTSLQTIERCGFKNATSCETIHLPNSITTLGDYAFENATSLKWIKIDATTPPTITNTTFNKASTTFKIYVPDSAVSDYKSSTWSSFSSRIFPISQFVTDFPNG